MPAGEYDDQGGEMDVLRPRVGPLDSALAALTAEFAAADERTRRAIRRAIRMEEFYTLLAFSRRVRLRPSGAEHSVGNLWIDGSRHG